MKRLVVFISGNGSNLQVLINAVRAGELAAEIVTVISNRRAAHGLIRAERADIPTGYFPLKPYREAGRSRETYDTDLAAHVVTYEPDLIILAGWMHIFSSAFLDHFPRQVLNLHPALPDQFAGTHAIERAYKAFQQKKINYTGVMIHWVVSEVDAGPVIVTERVPIYVTDKVSDLEMRIHAIEHRLLVETIKSLCPAR